MNVKSPSIVSGNTGLHPLNWYPSAGTGVGTVIPADPHSVPSNILVYVVVPVKLPFAPATKSTSQYSWLSTNFILPAILCPPAPTSTLTLKSSKRSTLVRLNFATNQCREGVPPATYSSPLTTRFPDW